MKKTATIILNRNLPEVTNDLHDHLKKFDGDFTDIYIVEAGSDLENLSKFYTWHANWDDAKKNGLRYSRGMNYGLSKLWEDNKFEKYEAFFLITNDSEFNNSPTIAPMLDILDEHKRIGILSPCSPTWGERLLLDEKDTKYFWFIHNNAYLIRREFVESVMNHQNPDYMNFLFDGNNFRGYGSEHELIAKAYMNDWAAAITTVVFASENESYLLNKSDLIKTNPYEENLKLYVEEGKIWLRNKYGFNSHWALQQYAKYSYDQFFDRYPEYNKYEIN